MAPLSRTKKLTGKSRTSIRSNRGFDNTRSKINKIKEKKRVDNIGYAQSYAKEVLAKSPKAQPDKKAQAELKKRLSNREKGGKSRFANPKTSNEIDIARYADEVMDKKLKGVDKQVKNNLSKNKRGSFDASGPAFKPKNGQTVFSANRGDVGPGLDSEVKILARNNSRLPGDKQIEKLVNQTKDRYMGNVIHAGDPANKLKQRKPVPVEKFTPAKLIKKNPSVRLNQIKEKAYSNLGNLDELGIDGGFKGVGVTAKSLFTGAKNHFHDPTLGAERRKAAFKGTFQAAAVSAGGHAGLALLSGDDPWEAAKTGAFRGALAGAGYQSLKGATGANTESIWGNMKHIGATTKDLYSATTIKGREQLRKEGMSNSLSNLLRAESGFSVSNKVKSTKGNVTTAQVMNQQ